MIIAIDGPAGSGKSSTARAVAARLGAVYLDTGAMYRAVTLKALRLGVAHTDDEALAAVMRGTEIVFEGAPPDTRIIMDGEDVSRPVRTDEVTKSVSDYCARDVVRRALVEQQRKIAAGHTVVCEGRDICTVVFPNAEVKIYMTASVEERANRRQKDFAATGINKSLEELISEIETRDRKDSTRANSPLTKAEGAIEMDTTGMTLDEQIEFIARLANKYMS
ncbi:MAG: (d)CMP kinase [Chitinispirillales bacterium]|jgi:cytidylate kinase|nr:(d)CMP kinase [Chitinispirillales bacterium]